MKYIPNVLILVLFGTISLFAQTDPAELPPDPPVSLAELSKVPLCARQRIEELNGEIKSQPQNADLYLQRAFCLQYNNDPAFLQDVSTALKLSPISWKNVSNIKSLIRTASEVESRQNLDYLIAANPTHWFPYKLRSELKSKQGDHQGALEDALNTIERSPVDSVNTGETYKPFESLLGDQSFLTFYERFLAAIRKKQTELRSKYVGAASAKEYFQNKSTFESWGSYFQSTSLNLASKAARLEMPEMENRLLEKMTRIEPRSRAFSYRSQYYRSKGNAQKATEDEMTATVLRLEETEDEIEKTSDARRKAVLYVTCGNLYFELRQYEKAVSNYETAVAFDPDVIVPTYRLNGARFQLEKTKQPPE